MDGHIVGEVSELIRYCSYLSPANHGQKLTVLGVSVLALLVILLIFRRAQQVRFSITTKQVAATA